MKTIVIAIMLSVSVVACAHTQHAAPVSCQLNYQFCLQSYIGGKDEFCQMQDDCTPRHWDELCKQDQDECNSEHGQ